MTSTFSTLLRFFLISMAIVLALGCPTKKTLLSTENTLSSCSVEVGGKNYDVTISATESTGSLNLPYGSDLSTLKVVAIKVSDKAKASLSAGSSITVSNNTFTIDVTAEDGTVNNYTISIVIGSPNTEAEITAFSFEKINNSQVPADVVATITKDTIKAAFPFGTNPNLTLIPTFSLSTGATVKVKDVEQSSGKSKQDFSSAVNYVVTAQDGKTTKTYVVMVLNSEAKFLSFQFEKAKNPTLKESSDITFNLTANPTQADVQYIGMDSFVPTFTVSTGAKVYVNDVEQKSGLSQQSFLNTVTYKIVAQSGATQTYKIAINYKSTDSFKVTAGGAISGNNTALTTAVIGEYMNGIRVTEIAGRGFMNYFSLTKLRLPNSLKLIGDYAFYYCDKISRSLIIPSSVTSIGDGAFQNCKGFSGTLIIPSSVTSIGNGAFQNCSGFDGDLIIPSSVTSIGINVFKSCSGFTGTLSIPSSVTSIGVNAFQHCIGFDGTLIIPSSVKSIGASAFSGCSGFDGDLSIPSSVTSIGDGAFNRCSGFTGDLIIPSSVTSIGKYAFWSCSGFTGDLSIPNSVKSIGDYAFQNCSEFTGDLSIPNSVTSIGDYAFQSCSGFNGTLIIPNSVKSIGDYAFWSCIGFTGTLNIPSSVTSIGNGAFSGCSGFKIVCNKSSITGNTTNNIFKNVSATFSCP